MTPRGKALLVAAAVTGLFAPAAVAFDYRTATSNGLPWEPLEELWWVAVLLVGATGFFEARARRLYSSRTSETSHARTRAALDQLSLSFACFGLAAAALVASFEVVWGAVLLGLLVAWVLVWLPPWMRRVVMSSSIQVASSREAAFDFLSNPNNWSRYLPDIELVEPVELPLHPGSVIRLRLRRGGSVLDGDETVREFERGRRFATRLLPPLVGSGTYDFSSFEGGTTITYTYRSTLGLSDAVLGVGLRRGRAISRMAARRGTAMKEVKRLLEDKDPVSV